MTRKFTGASLRTLALATLGLTLAGAAHAQVPDVRFLPRFQTTWQDVIKPNSGFFASGVAQEFAYTAGPGGVTSVAPPSTNLIANVRQVYGAAGEMTYFEILDGIRNVSFVRVATDTFTPIANGRANYLRASDWTRQAIVSDPQTLGWQYQSFAAWQTGLGQPTGSMGATSFGNETAWNGTTAVPQTGQATFNGFMGAIYNDAVGQDRAVTADVDIQMNFGAHTADFATRNTRDRNGAALDELNITGNFVGLPNFPQMFGSLSTGRLQGTSSGRFYGPIGEEFGGVFTLTPKSGEGLERLAGAFGSRSGAPAEPSRFASWSQALQPNATIFLNGVSSGFAGRFSTRSSTDDNAFYTLILDANKSIATMRLPGFFNFGVDAGHAIAPLASDPRFISASDPQYGRSALLADPVKLGWNYQSFGAWADSEGFVRGLSGGAATSPDALPPTGQVTFFGVALGNYEKTRGERASVTADVQVNADFAQRTATFRTSDWTNLADRTVFNATYLSGTLMWSPGSNALSGTVSTFEGRMTGGINARFYGPQAQEIGGAFAVQIGGIFAPTGTEYERLSGAFGAKR